MEHRLRLFLFTPANSGILKIFLVLDTEVDFRHSDHFECLFIEDRVSF